MSEPSASRAVRGTSLVSHATVITTLVLTAVLVGTLSPHARAEVMRHAGAVGSLRARPMAMLLPVDHLVGATAGPANATAPLTPAPRATVPAHASVPATHTIDHARTRRTRSYAIGSIVRPTSAGRNATPDSFEDLGL